MTEQWRPFNGDYDVSSLGAVRRRTPQKGTWPGRVLVPQRTRTGYLTVSLPRPVRRPSRTPHSRLVHQLVAEAFLGPRPPGHEVNHRDGVKTNNGAANLEYVTRSANIKHAIGLGLRARMTHLPPHRPGALNGRALLSAEHVSRIRRAAAQGDTQRALAIKYGVATSTISAIVQRKNWRHVA